MRPLSHHRGVSLPEVLIVLAILFLGMMVVVSALPRRREIARSAGCQKNLMQIGVAIALYEKSEGRIPTVPRLGTEGATSGGPLKTILEALVLPDLTELSDASKRPPPRPGLVPKSGRVPGFVCPSDRADFVVSPISYRATTGDDAAGSNGGFAPGRVLRLSDVEAGDGSSYTAAFSERLIGTPTRASGSGPADYFLTPGPISDQNCPQIKSPAWRFDAGSDWTDASWRSTLYTHAMTPNARPSCIAADDASARIGASSGHLGGVNVLIFDGSVRTTVSTVDPQIWKALATTHQPKTASPVMSPPVPGAGPR